LYNFLEKLHTIISIQRTAGSRRPQSSRTADTIATIEDLVKVKLPIYTYSVEYSFLFPLIHKM